MNAPTFKSKLNSIMKDNMYDRHVGNKRSGVIDNRSLSKIGYSDKVFSRKEERKNKYYNVSLLIDCSGSMNSGRLDAAIRMLEELVPLLNSMPSIDLEIHTFNTLITKIQSFGGKHVDKSKIDSLLNNALRSDYTLEYTPSTGETSHIYGIVRARKPEDKSREGLSVGNGAGGYNSDGLAINYVSEGIANKKGKNIVIVLSDGEPAPPDSMLVDHHTLGKRYEGMKHDDFNLKKEVINAMKKGIVFIGVGIQTDRVKQYYPKQNTAVVQDLNTMFSSLITVFNKQLKRQ